MIEHVIHLCRSGDGYTVRVEPEVTGFDFSLDAPFYRDARTFARGIRMARGFALVDHTGEEAAFLAAGKAGVALFANADALLDDVGYEGPLTMPSGKVVGHRGKGARRG